MDKNRQEIFLRDAKLDLDQVADKTPGLEHMADAKLEEMGLITGRAVTPPPKPKQEDTTAPSEPVAPEMPAFTADVELERAKPAGPDGIEGMTSQWELVQVKVKPSGVSPAGLMIVPEVVEGRGEIFFTSEFAPETDSDGIAGFGFRFARTPGVSRVRVSVIGATGGEILDLHFKAVQVQPQIHLGADYGRPPGGGEDSGSGGIATITAPGVIGTTTFILEEVDTNGNPVAPQAGKLRLFGRAYTSEEGGHARVPLLFVNSTGTARLRAVFPEIGDADGNNIEVFKDLNFDVELEGVERTAAILSGNGQIGYPGKELGEDFGDPIVVKFMAPTPPPDSGLTNKYISCAVTGGKVRLPNGTLAEGSFNVSVGVGDTVAFNFIMGPGDDMGTISLYGFWSTPAGAMPIDAPSTVPLPAAPPPPPPPPSGSPADFAVIRLPYPYLESSVGEQIAAVPMSTVADVSKGKVDNDAMFRIAADIPHDVVTGAAAITVQALDMNFKAVPAERAVTAETLLHKQEIELWSTAPGSDHFIMNELAVALDARVRNFEKNPMKYKILSVDRYLQCRFTWPSGRVFASNFPPSRPPVRVWVRDPRVVASDLFANKMLSIHGGHAVRIQRETLGGSAGVRGEIQSALAKATERVDRVDEINIMFHAGTIALATREGGDFVWGTGPEAAEMQIPPATRFVVWLGPATEPKYEAPKGVSLEIHTIKSLGQELRKIANPDATIRIYGCSFAYGEKTGRESMKVLAAESQATVYATDGKVWLSPDGWTVTGWKPRGQGSDVVPRIWRVTPDGEVSWVEAPNVAIMALGADRPEPRFFTTDPMDALMRKKK